MAHCDKDHEVEEVKKGMVDGKFGDYCTPHLMGTARKPGGYAAIQHRDQDAKDHRRDMIQPLDSKGRPNGEFIREYPAEAAEMFDEETMKGHDR